MIVKRIYLFVEYFSGGHDSSLNQFSSQEKWCCPTDYRHGPCQERLSPRQSQGYTVISGA